VGYTFGKLGSFFEKVIKIMGKILQKYKKNVFVAFGNLQ